MNRRYYVIISIILIAVVVVGLVYFYYNSYSLPVPEGLPPILYKVDVFPKNRPEGETSLTVPLINVSQGTTKQINLTLTSLYLDSPEIAIPVEDLKLIGYTSTIDYKSWNPPNWETSLIQERVFNYSFSLSELILHPNMSNSPILTISLADNAPLGEYALEVNFGQDRFLSTPRQYDKPYSMSMNLGMIVTPKLK